MKKRILILIALLLSSSTLTLCLNIPRHVNPTSVTVESPYPGSLFLLYSGIFTSLYMESWDTAIQAIREAALIEAPPELQFIISRFNDLLNEVSEDLKDVKARMETASNLIYWARFEEAENELDIARLSLTKANITVGELEASATQLSSMLHVTPQPLMEGISNLKALISQYHDELLLLLTKLLGYSLNPPTETQLTLNIENLTVQLGSNLTLKGELTTVDGEPLPSREIKIYLNDAQIGNSYTMSNGTYILNFKMPFIYRGSVKIYSAYRPKGDDYGKYTPATSKTVEVRLLYEKPVLEVEAPTSVYPTFNLNLTGRLKLNEAPLPNFNIKVWWLGSLKSLKTDTQGRYQTFLEVPPEVPSGYKEIKVESSPQGEIGPAYKTVKVKVVRSPIQTTINFPNIAFTGLKMVVSGSVSMNGVPLKDCSVGVRVGEWISSAKTGNDGTFTAEVAVPLLAPTSQYELIIRIKPKEAWIETKVQKERILLINLIGISAVPAIFGGVTFLTAKRMGWIGRERKKPSKKVEVYTAAEKEIERKFEPRGIPSIYLRAVTAVSNFTGIPSTPQLTIREYLSLVKPTLKKAYKPFEKLSLDYEAWLYAPPTIEIKIDRLEKLLEELLKALKR